MNSGVAETAEFPWTLVAAIIAAVASVFAVIQSSRLHSKRNRLDVLLRMATLKHEWAASLRHHASEYISQFMFFSQLADRDGEDGVDKGVDNYRLAFLHLAQMEILLGSEKGKPVSDFNNAVVQLFTEKKHAEILKKIATFDQIIHQIIQPEIDEVERQIREVK